MNSKARFIPLIVLGAIVLSLIAIIPAFSATGQLRFYDVDDEDEDQKWARSGGLVHLEVDDPDLDVPIKYVILPSELTNVGEIESADGKTLIVKENLTIDLLDKGDTVIVAGETVREVMEVVPGAATSTVTLLRAFSEVLPNKANLQKVTLEGANASDCPTCAMAQKIDDTDHRIEVDQAPIVDSGVGDKGDDDARVDKVKGDESGGVNSKDVLIAALNGTAKDDEQAIRVDRDEEEVIIKANITATDKYLIYWGSAKNDTGVTVKVRSSADRTGITVVLTETGKSTGVFQGSVELTGKDSDAAAATPLLRVNPSGTVTLRYNDNGTTRSEQIEVETTRPVISNFSPAHESAGTDDRPDFGADVTDSDSGVDKVDLFMVFALLGDDGGILAVPQPHSVRVDEAGSLTNITGGVSVEDRLPREVESTDDSTIGWWVVAQDMAGNVAVSDQDDATDCILDGLLKFPALDEVLDGTDYTDPIKLTTLTGDAGCEPFIVRVDETDPTLDSSRTGAFWDTDIADPDKTNIDSADAKRTSIQLVFNEALNGASVSASDFEVDDRTPLDADHYSDAPMFVFLTVPALDPDDDPTIELVGEVEDLAGNSLGTGKLESDEVFTEDGIGPDVEVTLAGTTTGDRPVTDGEITITVVTNENTSNPIVKITMIGATDADGNGLLTGDTVTRTPKVKEPRTYEMTWTASSAGLYNVHVTASDSTGNDGDAGVSGRMDVDNYDTDPATSTDALVEETVNAPIDLSSDTSAILFEVDMDGPEFVLNPAESDDPNAFIRIDFSSEGSENSVNVRDPGPDMYHGNLDRVDDDDGNVDANGKKEGETGFDAENLDTDDLDSYSMVTVLSATLAGDDISDSLERLGSDSFLFAAPDLDVGDYKIVIDAEDSAGNDNESTMTLKITERKPFALNIRAGVSLLSFPGDPVDSDINSVFPAEHPVQEVITYDPTQPGKWFASKRDETTGMLDGNLMRIVGGQAYLVRSESTKSVSVVIDRPSSHDLITPPQIDLVAGWNLIPVLDVTFGLAQGDTIAYSHYFGDNAAINRVYGVDTVLNRLVLVRGPQTDDDDDFGDPLEVGKGYWVFASEATSVAPGVTPDE